MTGFTSPNPVPTATSTPASVRASRTSSAHGTTSATVLAAASPDEPNRIWPLQIMLPVGNSGSFSGAAPCANPRSPNCAATRLACPRCPPALSTRTFTVDAGTGATASSDLGVSTVPGGGPAVGAGQATPPALLLAVTSTVVQVATVAVANTITTVRIGPRRRRR